MRILLKHIGEFELKKPLSYFSCDEFALAPGDAAKIWRLIRSKDVLRRVDMWTALSIRKARGIEQATIIRLDNAEDAPGWVLHISLYSPDCIFPEEDYVFFDILDGLSVVQVNYRNYTEINVCHNVGWVMPCIVSKVEEGSVYLNTPDLYFIAEQATSTRARLTLDHDGYLMTHYLDDESGVLQPVRDRLEGKIIQSVIIDARE